MATMYEEQYGDTEPTAEDIQDMMVEKAHELFSVCDTEKKGFITKRDMQRLQKELPLQPDQLEAVFDALDEDKNGYLTLEEFTDGFGSFLGLSTSEVATSLDSGGGSQEKIFEVQDGDEVEQDLHFQEMMENTGAKDLFDDEFTIKGMWGRLRNDEPQLMSNFETFLSRVSSEIKQSQSDFSTLESALRSKSSAHDEEVQKLYEEMELQIKQEKNKILAEEKEKERQLRDEMDRELSDKDQQLQELFQKHSEMQKEMCDLNVVEVETKNENDRLLREKELLEEKLISSQQQLQESQVYVAQLRLQQRSEKRERAKAAIHMTEGIAMERESLVKQLDVLRDMNKQLRDDKDIAEASQALESAPVVGEALNGEASEQSSHSKVTKQEASRAQLVPRKKKELFKQGSVLSNYFTSTSREHPDDRQSQDSKSSTFEEEVGGADITDAGTENLQAHDLDPEEDEDIECDDDLIQENLSMTSSFAQSFNSNGHNPNLFLQNLEALEVDEDYPRRTVQNSTVLSELNNREKVKQESRRHSRVGKNRQAQQGQNIQNLDDVTSSENDLPDNSKARAERRLRKQRKRSLAAQGKENDSTPEHKRSSQEDFSPLSARVQPVGANDTTERSSSPQIRTQDMNISNPERVFKIVFVGDSGVGKSSFIHRFCNNHFKPTFSATIGVDFQVRNMVVDGHVIALQLWDTAGQERFRGITKQYFRKADGVLIMYDVTSETSFMNVRNWMTSVQDGVEEGTVLVVVGNKSDLIENDQLSVVKQKDGIKLSDEYGAFFYETSAKSGSNVAETLEAMANMLVEKEDREIQNALNLEEKNNSKKGCCS